MADGINFDTIVEQRYTFTKNGKSYELSDAIPADVMIEGLALKNAMDQVTRGGQQEEQLLKLQELQRLSTNIALKIFQRSVPEMTALLLEETFDIDERLQIIAFFLSHPGKKYAMRQNTLNQKPQAPSTQQIYRKRPNRRS